MSSDAEQSENEKPELDIDDLRDDLTACFASATRAGSFAYSTSHPVFPNPALKVKGIGTVGLPLSDRDVVALKGVCHAAPFGKGAETLVDENVRRTWEIDARDVTFANPQWDEYVQKTIVPKVTEELGVENGSTKFTRAEPYKLLLYEPGAHFRAHQDSEKVERMYATLVVCLPSEHLGGEVVLRHGGSTKTWGSAVGSGVEMSYGAWYADVTHEVTTVTYGHRLVLTYNLVDTGPSDALHSAAEAGSLVSKFQRVYERWGKSTLMSDSGDFAYISCTLEHQYTESSLSLRDLKGKDSAIVAQAAKAAEIAGFTICLATLEVKREGTIEEHYCGFSCGHDDDNIIDEIDTRFQLKHVVDLGGNTVAKDIDVAEESILPKDFFANESYDDKDVEGYTGNEGATATLWYKKAAMVIVPSHAYVDLLLAPVLQGSASLSDLSRTWLNAYYNNPSNEPLAKDLRYMCNVVLGRIESRKKERSINPMWGLPDEVDTLRKFSDSDLGYIAEIAAALKNPELLQRAVNAVSHSLPFTMFSSITRNIDMDSFGEYQDSLTRAVNQIGHLQGVAAAIVNLRRGFETQSASAASVLRDGLLSTFDAWSRELVQSLLARVAYTSREDADSLITLFTLFRGDMLLSHVFPYVHRHSSVTPFAVRFLARFGSSKNTLLSEDEILAAEEKWTHVLQHTLVNIYMAKLGEKAQKPLYASGGSGQDGTPYGDYHIQNYVDPQSAAFIFGELLDRDERARAYNFAFKLIESGIVLSRSASLLYADAIVPFLGQLIESIKRRNRALADPLMQELFIKTLVAYRDEYIKAWPQPPNDQRLPRLQCKCDDCRAASAFLDSQNIEWRFKAGQSRRGHVERRLEGKPLDCTTDGTGNPHTLIVRKNGNWVEMRRKRWAHRVSDARKAMKTLHDDDLRNILGEQYDSKEIVKLKEHTQTPQRQPLQPVQPSAANHTTSSIPAKRKAESDLEDVIDLT